MEDSLSDISDSPVLDTSEESSVVGDIGDEMVLSGFRTSRGKEKFIVDGFSYERERDYKQFTYWKCERSYKYLSSCRGRMKTTKGENDGRTIVKITGEHNHEPVAIRKPQADIVTIVKRTGIENCGAKPSRILNDVMSQVDSSLRREIDTKKLRDLVRKSRKRNASPHPPAPET